VSPGDDANAPGHECQAETVDIAPTIAALLHVGMSDKQLAGRFLQEAFQPSLSFPKEDEELPPPDADETPPLPEPDIYIPPPPPPPKGFDFDGLYRDLSATVVDKDGCTWDKARAGSKLDYLKIEGDFGKPHAAVTLTFYQRPATASSKRRRVKSAVHVRATAVAPNRKSRCQAKAGASRVAAAPTQRDLRTKLKAIAHFKPFKLERGHVVLRLKVPDQFHPTHVGILVREARTLDKPGPDGLKFQAIGPAAGSISSIGEARRLHALKPSKKKVAKKPTKAH
jgi:hypothetical protein